MSMKHLLKILSAVAITGPAAVSVVACNPAASAPALKDVFKETNLEQINTADAEPTADEIIAAIQAKNKDINKDGIKAITEITTTSAKVTPDGKVYRGDAVNVKFTVNQKVGLNTVLTSKKANLGNIPSNTPEKLLEKLKGISDGLVPDNITLKNITKDNAVVSVTPNGIYKGNPVTITFVVQTQLKDSLKVSDLGTLADANDGTIRKALKAKNDKLDTDAKNIKIEDINPTTEGAATYTAKVSAETTGIYQGAAITVNFINSAAQTDLSTVITSDRSDLGNISKKDDDHIFAKLGAIDNNLTAANVSLTISETDNSAEVKPTTDGIYKGDAVQVTFVVQTDLSTVLTDKELGTLADATDGTIRTALKAKNDKLDTDAKNIKIEDINPTAEGAATYTAKVSAETAGIYQGDAVQVTFVVQTDLSTVLTDKELGTLADANDGTIRTALKAKNDKLDTDAKNIKIEDINPTAEGAATYTAKVSAETAGIYQGAAITVNFINSAAQTDLSTVLIVTDLGELDNEDDATVRTALHEKNKDTNLNTEEANIQVDVIPSTEGENMYTVIVTPKPTGIYKGTPIEDITFTVRT